ncbi:MAG: putative beta-lysine N-acetyltransferase [Candidatus Krumholzibacteriia bacterium]
MCPDLPDPSPDVVERLGGSLVQHGPYNDRIYLIELDPDDVPDIVDQLDELRRENDYAKVFAKVPAPLAEPFQQAGYRREAMVPGFFNGEDDGLFLARFHDDERRVDPRADEARAVLRLADDKHVASPEPLTAPGDFVLGEADPEDAEAMASVFREIFPSYPFPIHDPDFLRANMAEDVRYFVARRDGRVVACSSAELDPAARNAEMTDFATLHEARGQGLALHLLDLMEREIPENGIVTAYTIARALSPGMNITFARHGYAYGGTLVNNTNISGHIESMNVWYKPLEREDAT